MQFASGLQYADDCLLRDRAVSSSSSSSSSGGSWSGTLNERLYALQEDNWNVTAVVNATITVPERFTHFQAVYL